MMEARRAPDGREAAFELAAPDDFGSATGAKGEETAAGLDGMSRFFILAAMLTGVDRIFVFNVIR